jgi:hypothetical protein
VVACVGNVNGDGRADFALGAPLYDGSAVDSGRMYVFRGVTGTPSTAAMMTMGTSFSGHMGSSISAADFNRDGLFDILESEPTFSDSASTPNEGRIRVFHGRKGGIDAVPEFTLEGGFSGARLGTATAAGRANGDGYGDAAWTVPGASRVELRRGQW